MRSLICVLFVSIVLASCTGCGEELGTRPINDQDVISDYGDVLADEAQLSLLEKDLNDYLLSQGEGRFEDLINWAHPNFITSDADYRMAVESMQDFYDRGVRNDLQEWNIDQVFPLQDLDSMWVCLVRYQIHNKINIMDYFDGIAGNYLGHLKQQFSFAEVSYDSTITQYTVLGSDYIYAFYEKENDNMYFMSTAIVQSPVVYSMIDHETLGVLRSYQY